jgi:hypothetical protein
VRLLRGPPLTQRGVHLPDVGGGQLVEALVADGRHDVQVDGGAVVAAGGGPDFVGVDFVEPPLEPFGDGGVAGDGDAAGVDVGAEFRSEGAAGMMSADMPDPPDESRWTILSSRFDTDFIRDEMRRMMRDFVNSGASRDPAQLLWAVLPEPWLEHLRRTGRPAPHLDPDNACCHRVGVMMKRMVAALVVAAGLLSGCASLWPRGMYPSAPPPPPVPENVGTVVPNPEGGPPIVRP